MSALLAASALPRWEDGEGTVSPAKSQRSPGQKRIEQLLPGMDKGMLNGFPAVAAPWMVCSTSNVTVDSETVLTTPMNAKGASAMRSRSGRLSGANRHACACCPADRMISRSANAALVAMRLAALLLLFLEYIKSLTRFCTPFIMPPRARRRGETELMLFVRSFERRSAMR